MCIDSIGREDLDRAPSGALRRALPAAVAAVAPSDARGSYQGAWAMVFALAIGSALFLAGLGRDLVGWSATWLGFVGLTLLAAAGLAVFGGRLGRATATRTAAASK